MEAAYTKSHPIIELPKSQREQFPEIRTAMEMQSKDRQLDAKSNVSLGEGAWTDAQQSVDKQLEANSIASPIDGEWTDAQQSGAEGEREDKVRYDIPTSVTY